MNILDLLKNEKLLLRVGIDMGYGSLSPVFEDKTFEYIPIYYKNKKEVEKSEKRCFKDLIGVKGKPLSEYLPVQIQEKKVHLDPEFETFTYGEVKNPKRGALLKLEKGDLLIFYMGGYYINKPFDKHCFIFGYFEVERIYDWEKDKDVMKMNCKNNAHIISSKSKENLVIVKGTDKSRMFDKCIQITNIPDKKGVPYITKPEYVKNYGIREFIVRANPIWIKEEKYINNFLKLINY